MPVSASFYYLSRRRRHCRAAKEQVRFDIRRSRRMTAAISPRTLGRSTFGSGRCAFCHIASKYTDRESIARLLLLFNRRGGSA